MKILSFGSLNLDHVYSVPHFVAPGETLMSSGYKVCFGGKGLNQSIAAARAGAQVVHTGAVGQGGQVLSEYLAQNGVDTSLLKNSAVPQGHAIIQVSPEGENCIMLYAGSNFDLDKAYVDSVFAAVKGPGYVMLQNEISELDYIIRSAAEAGFEVVLNASPFNEVINQLDLNKLSWLLINEIEGAEISGRHEPDEIIAELCKAYPKLGVVLTLGSQGCVCVKGDERVSRGIFRVPVVDTTGAGDTFTGYFIASLAQGLDLAAAVEKASAAAAIAVSSAGAAQSIPYWEDVEAFLQNN